ncbi:hypothetical protein Poly30_46500 [Planctomycetes bacterium Poly30]|uniref:Uncharacterized protein n=1 Tax=Saltatorellus ferox TaxID=2528018 RepID=A0A518EYE0_9BACT|nr:hypothetical protein Poly30_46500 [Planctomycetes bacterium Poly30]
MKKDVSALRAVAVALPVRVKRVAKIKLLKKKSSARRLATMGVAFLAAGALALIVLGLASAMALFGLASAIAAVLDVPLWGGLAITGFGVLAGSAAAVVIGWKRYSSKRRDDIRKALDEIGLSHYRTPSPPAQGSTPS